MAKLVKQSMKIRLARPGNWARISGHSRSDKNYYRSAEEIAGWKERDPILLLKNRLLRDGAATEAEIAEMTAEADRIIDDAVAYAQAHGIAFQISDPKPAKRIIKAYADNFAFGRKQPWTH